MTSQNITDMPQVLCGRCWLPVDDGNKDDSRIPNYHNHDGRAYHHWCCDHGDADWTDLKAEHENCLRCGLSESDQKHDRKNPPTEGWHVFRGQEYLDGLEEALLFVREKKQLHQWVETGWVIDTIESFNQKYCSVCGATNWGGKEDSICFGNKHAESAIIAAHNRRATG